MNDLVPQAAEGAYPYANGYDNDLYEEELYGLQIELLKLQKDVKEKGKKVIILFEGRDAAGKGGTIQRFVENMNPRGARIVALAKPTDAEKGQWFFQRYVNQLPSPGEIVFFDLLLVQPGRGGTRHGLLHQGADRALFTGSSEL